MNGNISYETATGSRWPSTISGLGALDLGAATRTFTIFDNINPTGDLVISSIIQNGGITKTQTGVLALSGVNTYSLGTTLNLGTILLSGSGTLGSTSGSLTVNGGTLNLGGTNQTVGIFNGSGGTINTSTGTSTLTVGNGGGSGSYAAQSRMAVEQSCWPRLAPERKR